MIWTVVITIVVVFFILVVVGGAIEKQNQLKVEKDSQELAKRRALIMENERKQKEQLMAEINQYRNQISNYEAIETELKNKTLADLESFLKDVKRRVYLSEKYGEKEGLQLFNHQYWIGMTEEQVLDIKGKPSKVEIEALKSKTKRILIYGNKSSGDVFTVVNGQVERFVDR